MWVYRVLSLQPPRHGPFDPANEDTRVAGQFEYGRVEPECQTYRAWIQPGCGQPGTVSMETPVALHKGVDGG